MLEVTPSISSKIRNMSIVSAFLVMMIHCRPNFEVGTLAWWVKQFLENGITQIAVPYFFLVSGFFIAPKLLDNRAKFVGGGYKLEVMKRVHSLVVPFFIWLTIFWLFTQGFVNLVNWHNGRAISLSFPTLCQWGIWYKDCPILTPLWYVRGLFLLVLASPVLLWLLRRMGAWALLAMFVVYGAMCPYSPMPYWTEVQRITRCGVFPVLGIFYFSLGMAIRMGMFKLTASRSWAIASLMCSLVLIFLRAQFNDSIISSYFGMLSIPLALYGVWCLMPSSNWPQWLVKNAFAIYLIHKFILFILVILIKPGRSVLAYLSVAAIAFAVSLIVANLTRAISPKLSGIMFGGR